MEEEINFVVRANYFKDRSAGGFYFVDGDVIGGAVRFASKQSMARIFYDQVAAAIACSVLAEAMPQYLWNFERYVGDRRS